MESGRIIGKGGIRMKNRDIVIRVEHLKKSFEGKVILDDISLCCEKGTITGIVGYNGCGKSVLFKCICGFYMQDEGEIYIRGRKKEKKEIVKQTGIIIEEPCFLSNKSGYENLMLLYMIRNKKNRQRIDDVMKTVGLNPKDKKAVSKYSLGMKQRLAIAQAIMEEQDILILDEPFNGLDKEGMKEMRKLFQNLKSQGRTMLFASHNPQDIEYLCDTVYEIDSGRLIHKL